VATYSQLLQSEEKLKTTEPTRKRKRVSNENSNKKLISVQAILKMQKLADGEKGRRMMRERNTQSKRQENALRQVERR
jgi:hypothetical protein